MIVIVGVSVIVIVIVIMTMLVLVLVLVGVARRVRMAMDAAQRTRRQHAGGHRRGGIAHGAGTAAHRRRLAQLRHQRPLRPESPQPDHHHQQPGGEREPRFEALRHHAG